MNRWDELAALSDGWLDGQGRAITNQALAKAKEIAAQKPNLRIYPTEQGGVLLEDPNTSWEVSPEGLVETY